MIPLGHSSKSKVLFSFIFSILWGQMPVGMSFLPYTVYTSCLILGEFLQSQAAFRHFPPTNTKRSPRNYCRNLHLAWAMPAASVTHKPWAFITCLELYPLTTVVMMALGKTSEAWEISVSFKSRGAFWSLILLTKVSQIEKLKTVDHHLCYHGDCRFFPSVVESTSSVAL